MKKKLIIFLWAMLIMPISFAAYFTNVPQIRVQPNGDTLRCFATGDEYFHRLHDASGFTIVLDPATGYYVYADKVGDALVPTSHIAGRVNPAEVGLVAGLSISAEQWRARRERWEAPARSRTAMRDGEPNHGHINNIVVFIRFADDSPFVNEFSEVESMFNDSTDGYSSMYNYFQSATYNQLAITSTFYPPQSGTTVISYQDIYQRSYFEPLSSQNPDGYDENDDNERTYREHSLLARAIDAIADMVPEDLDIDYNDDGYVDNVVFVVKGDVGDWNALLWPHRWALYSEYAYINGLRVWDFNFQLADATHYFNNSVLCHEMNHSLGAPDLYHYYEGTDLAAVSIWDLMHQNTNPPQHMGAYMKYKYGHWIDDIPEITECGTYSLRSLGSSATNNCYRIASPNENEFFVLEYRNTEDLFEGTLPSSGLLVYRINTDFEGNAQYDGVTVFDEVYVYRPFGTATENGYIGDAPLAANNGRTEMSANTNPQPFLTDGTVVQVGDFTIRNVSEAGGDSITFTFCEMEYIEVVPEQLLIDAAVSSSGTLQVNSDMSWEITGGCEWLSYSPAADSGSVAVQFTALSENTAFESRTCQLLLTASNGTQLTITIEQRGQEPFLEAEITGPVSGSMGILYHENSTCSIEINSNIAWTLTSDVEWLGLSQTEGDGSASVTATALTENTTCVPRYATLTLVGEFGQTIELYFMQYNFYNGTFSVTPTSLTIANYMDSTAQLMVTSTDTWNVLNSPSWLSVSPVTGGAYDNTITLTVTATTASSSPRTGTVVISDICGRTDSEVHITVTQPAGYITLSVPSVEIGPEQGSTATASLECSGAWNLLASTVPEWLSVTPSSATGNADLEFTALSDNQDAVERTAVLRFRYTMNMVAELLVTQSVATGIVEVADVSASLSPNPVTDILTVKLEGPSAFTLYDVSGRAIKNGQLSPMDNTLSLAEFETGAYFLRLSDLQTGKTKVFKIIKR